MRQFPVVRRIPAKYVIMHHIFFGILWIHTPIDPTLELEPKLLYCRDVDVVEGECFRIRKGI